MRLRSHRRDLVVWNQLAGPADRCEIPRVPRSARTRRIRRGLRTGALLMIIGLMPLVRAMRARWRPLLAGGVLTVVGVMLRGHIGGVVLLPGLLFLLFAPLVPADPHVADMRRPELERELAAYSTPAQRCDLEALLDRYPDGATRELRDILARQAMASYNNGIPGGGRS